MSSILLYLDTGDVVIDAQGKMALTQDLQSIQQHLKIKLGIFLGEWFLDLDVGVPWFRDILIKNPSFQIVKQVLQDQILNTQGVIQLLEFDLDLSRDRILTLNFKALCTNGVIDFSENIEV